LPSLTDGSGALVGRFIVLLFQKSFYGKENVGLTRELLAELSGILNWALDGYDSLVKRGHFEQPKNASDNIKKWNDLLRRSRPSSKMNVLLVRSAKYRVMSCTVNIGSGARVAELYRVGKNGSDGFYMLLCRS
jgi:hypothetical protein